MKRRAGFCDGVARRDFLRVGSAGLFGSLWTLPGLTAYGDDRKLPGNDRSLVIVFLRGGLSTIDTWDLKPDAPAEFRGEFRPISTNVSGIQLGESLPLSARPLGQYLVEPSP